MSVWHLRAIAFIPPGALAAWAWESARYLAGWYGLGIAGLACYLLWPCLMIAVAFGPGAAAAHLITPRLRCWWRYEIRKRKRPAIRARLRRCVYSADRYRCAYCRRADLPLQLDHIRPWAAGGLTSLFNMITLCEDCNRVKSNFWIWRSGHVSYRPWPGADDQATAAAILAVELRVRLNPLRWVRAAWSLA